MDLTTPSKKEKAYATDIGTQVNTVTSPPSSEPGHGDRTVTQPSPKRTPDSETDEQYCGSRRKNVSGIGASGSNTPSGEIAGRSSSSSSVGVFEDQKPLAKFQEMPEAPKALKQMYVPETEPVSPPPAHSSKRAGPVANRYQTERGAEDQFKTPTAPVDNIRFVQQQTSSKSTPSDLHSPFQYSVLTPGIVPATQRSASDRRAGQNSSRSKQEEERWEKRRKSERLNKEIKKLKVDRELKIIERDRIRERIEELKIKLDLNVQERDRIGQTIDEFKGKLELNIQERDTNGQKIDESQAKFQLKIQECATIEKMIERCEMGIELNIRDRDTVEKQIEKKTQERNTLFSELETPVSSSSPAPSVSSGQRICTPSMPKWWISSEPLH